MQDNHGYPAKHILLVQKGSEMA